jgi:hypothetical protein
MCLNANYDCVLQCWRVWLNNRIFFTSSLWDSLSSSTTDLGWDQTVFLEILTITGCQQGMDVVQCFGNYWTKVSMSACALGTNWSSTCLFYVLWVETISTWSVKQEEGTRETMKDYHQLTCVSIQTICVMWDEVATFRISYPWSNAGHCKVLWRECPMLVTFCVWFALW